TCLSVTDHDTVDGIDRAIQAGRQSGITIIPGVELSACDFGRHRKVHILGYDFDPENSALKSFCRTAVEQRQLVALKMIERIRELGYQITVEEVMSIAAESTNIYKQHIMVALKNKGYTTELFGELKQELFSADSGKAYFPLTDHDARDAVRIVREAGGIPVLAHPGLQGNWEIISELVPVGLEGIEVYHSGHDDNMIAQAIQFAEKYRLLKTAGSDFHGIYDKAQAKMGYPVSLIADFIASTRLNRYFGR
ncbi:MAG: PHP domain-containing protein, partial [bacterium]